MELFKRVVRAVQLATALATAAFVILLFANEPQKGQPIPKTGTAVGKAIYQTRCSGCHGTDGSGGFGPALASVVVDRFPDPADEEAVVSDGRGAMPGFGDTLTPEQISAVVEYTRTDL